MGHIQYKMWAGGDVKIASTIGSKLNKWETNPGLYMRGFFEKDEIMRGAWWAWHLSLPSPHNHRSTNKPPGALPVFTTWTVTYTSAAWKFRA